ncbi:MAG TPA: biotin--[acetyl-CoA-carboxylase] ligase, partial [Gemmatimonadota bacterium]|nr:biotin--[acetyl-CoA-carboxylase] ligase [Gemmatimonadota bacterium]
MIGGLEERLGVRVVEHGRIDSTMAAALSDPGSAPCVHLAESQTAGRGRHGRSWESPPGNLYATIRWVEGVPAFPPGLLGAVQVEWMRAIRAAGGPDVRCKWPNDGWLNGAKWAGLIAVRPAERPGEIHVGLGANLVAAPAGVEEPAATDLRSGWPGWPGTAAVTESLLIAALEVLQGGSEGIAPRLADWARYDALVPGEALAVERAGRRRTGTYLGIDPDGHLRLGEESGEVRLASGQVLRVRAL